MNLKEEANEIPSLLDYQQNCQDSVYLSNQEYVLVNPEGVKDPSREYPVPAECSETIFLDPIQ